MIIDNLNKLKVGDFIKFSGKDGKEKFSYSGEVVEINKSTKFVKLLTYDGWMEILIPSKDHIVEQLSQPPSGWKKYKQNPDEIRKNKKEEKIKEQQEIYSSQKTLREEVFDFIRDSKGKNEAVLLQKAIKFFKKKDDNLIRNYVKLAIIKLNIKQ